MRRQLTWLSDAEWARIEPLLPRGRKGARRVDDRRVISGIVHMLKSGARWRDCPPEYGPYTTVYNRFNRWSRQGLWLGMFEALTGHNGIWGTVAIDAGVSEFLCPGRVELHAMMKRSSNKMANWDFASPHSRGGIFHSAVASRKTSQISFVAASSVGK